VDDSVSLTYAEKLADLQEMENRTVFIGAAIGLPIDDGIGLVDLGMAKRSSGTNSCGALASSIRREYSAEIQATQVASE
jgi:hypothetical protein